MENPVLIEPDAVLHGFSINKKFWEELMAYFPLIRDGPYRKRRPQTILLMLRVFVATGTCIPSRCLATTSGDTYTDRLM
jgi:hypothetical protein